MTARDWLDILDKRPHERSECDLHQITLRLHRIKPFATLPSSLLREFAKIIYIDVLDPGITVCHAGDFGTNWYVILKGCLEVTYFDYIPNKEGSSWNVTERTEAQQNAYQKKIATTLNLCPGGTFGESILTGDPRGATVVTKGNCELLRIEQSDFFNLWERNQELMENLVGGIRQGSNENSEQQFQESIDVEQIPEDAEALQRLRVSSSGEDSEDSERRQKNNIPSNKDSSSSNWSPRTALRHLSSFRRKSRDVKRKGSGDARSYSFSSGVRQSPSPSRKSLSRRFSRNAIEEKSSTISPAPPIRIATRSVSPTEVEVLKNSNLEEIVSVSPTNKPEKIIANEENDPKSQTRENSPVLDKSKTGSKESLIKNHISSSPSTIARDNENMNVEVLKQNIKLHINSKKFSENPIKSLSRSGLSPGTLKKAFQFTRSSSWTQRKLANASPPCIPKIRQEPPQPKEPSSNSPSESPRRPSLIRASSFDSQNAGTPSPKGTPKNEILKELKTESLETPEEDENEADDDSDKSDDEDDDLSEKTWGVKKERGSVQHDRSQELDSPSNAALPILETPSVRGCEAAWVLRTLVLVRAPHLLQDRKSGNIQVPRCGVGAEMTEWLLNQSSSIHSRAQAAAMWQVLLEEGALIHVTCEQPFRDKFLFYRFLEDNDVPVGEMLPTPSSQEKKDAEERLPSIIAFLIQRAPDATLRLVLRKPSHERTFEDQELIYEELLHLRALSHLSNSVKRELAAVIKFESHMREGAVLFEQGCEGKSWFIIVKGSVDVVIRGKGVVNTLQEGDDFGKLALVNDAPRAATIVLKEDNCQFLRVDKGDFNRILRDVEANTVRLKEHGKDVLVLEKVSSSHTHSQYKYTVMAGTPQKMLEHLLETRLDGRRICNTETLTMGVGVAVGMGVAMGATIGGGDSTSDSHLTIRRCEFSTSDFFLDDFLLTHIVFMPYDQLTAELYKHYRVSEASPNQDNAFILACKRRVVHFTHRWTMTISDPVFANKDASNFLRNLKKEVEEDTALYGAALRDEVSLMLSVVESLDRYEQEISAVGVSKWKLPTSGKPISLFGASSVEDGEDFHRKIHSHDDIIFRVYCADHTYCTLRFPLSANGETIKRSAADKLGLNLENMVLVELKSNGDVVDIEEREICVPTGITINGRLFVAHKDHLDALTTLSDQDGPSEGSYAQLEMFSTKELAFHITSYDWDLFTAIHEYEFLYQAFGRYYFGEVMCNLDVFRRRFNELQFWVATEICHANTLSKRTQLLRKFIKLAAYCKEQQNLNAFFAIVIGLSNVAVSRLTQTWERLSSRFRKMYIEFEILIDPSRNHRAYRLYVAKLHPPIIPFTPLLMKDMTFTHEGNRTDVDGLVNFEKMHMLAQTLRTIRYCRSKSLSLDPPAVPKNESEIRLYVRNLQVIDNQRRLLTLSQRLEPKRP